MTPATETDRLIERLRDKDPAMPGIQRGNEGIPCESGSWQGPQEKAPLPGYPNAHDKAERDL